jgi:hypothetical protein
MDNQPVEEQKQQEEKNQQTDMTRRYNKLISRWYNALPSNNLVKLLLVVVILAAIPLTVKLLQKPQITTQQAATNTSTNVYGSAIGMDSLNNTQIGGRDAQTSSYRFRATTTSALNSIQIYIVGPNHPGYGAGTGGLFEISVQTDDGTSNHAPSGTVLSRTTFVPVDGLPLITFPSPPPLISGQLYHIVFSNIDASPSANFASLDGVFMYHPTTPRQAFSNDVDWGQPLKYPNGTWQDRNDTIPIMQLNYADGTKAGMGYMEISYAGAGEIGVINGTNNMVRELFTVSGGNRIVSGASIRVQRLSGSDPLVVALEDNAGNQIDSFNIPAANIPLAPNTGSSNSLGQAAVFASGLFHQPQTLTNGQTYRLRLSTTSTSTYNLWVIRKGVDYKYTNNTYFSDGYSQKTTDGSTWSSLGRVANENDLQFYFTTTSSASISTPTQKIIQLSPTVTKTQLLSAIADETVDVIELASGTYHLGSTIINVDRVKPIIVRPATGSVVIFSGDVAGPASNGQFLFGYGGVAGNITMQGFIFDGWSMGHNGIIWLGNAHNITVNNMTVRNPTGQPPYSWALYCSEDGTSGSSDIIANNWVVDGGSRTLGGLAIGHTPAPARITANGWVVTNAAYPIYSSTTATGVHIDGWTINSSGITETKYLSVVLVNTEGTISNVRATNSGGPEIELPMVDSGGNTWSTSSSTPTTTPTLKPTATSTPIPTSTPTITPTLTLTPTPTLKPTNTPTPKPTATPTPKLLITSTPTPTITINAATPTPIPQNKKNCFKVWHWQFCY